jgi:hypothetical protein
MIKSVKKKMLHLFGFLESIYAVKKEGAMETDREMH